MNNQSALFLEATAFELYDSPTFANTKEALILAVDKITAKLSRLPDDAISKKQLIEQKAYIEKFIKEAYKDALPSMKQESASVAKVVYDSATLDIATKGIPIAVVDDLMSNNRQIQGYDFKDLFEVTADSHARQLKTILASAVASGTPVATIIKDIRLKSENLTDGQLKTNVYTTIKDSRETARYASYEEFETLGIVDYYKFNATLDFRTSSVCRGLDNRIYKMKLAEIPNKPPIHFNCRSVLIQVPKNNFKTDNKRASMFGQTEFDNYGDWFNSIDDATKQKFMTPAKWKQYQAGNFKVISVVDLVGKKLDLKEVAEVMKPKAVPVIDFGYDGKFNKYVEDIRDEAKIVIDKVRQPYEILSKGMSKGSYYFQSKNVTDGKSGSLISREADGKNTFLHEYGHHIDYNISKNSGKGISYQRSLDKDFVDARTLDIKYLKEKFSGQDIFVELKNKWKGKAEFFGASDIFDSLSLGKFRDSYGMSGHGSRYYNAKSGLRVKHNKSKQQTEVFAQLFEGYATGGKVWDNILEHYPNQAKVFEKTIKEVINE